MANNDSATPITTGSVTAEPKKNGIYYFKLDSRYFLYDGDEQRLCGLTGAEIDSDLHFLSGMDIKNVEFGEDKNTVVITRVNGEDFSAITLDLTEVRPKELVFSAETGDLYLVYPDGTSLVANGFFVDFNDEGKYNVKIYTDGTIDGLGTESSPLSLSKLERTGTFAPVEKLVESGNVQDYKGKRVLTKELIDDYGHLYTYEEVLAIQSALADSPWRVATKKDWDELLNAMETSDYRAHADYCGGLDYTAGKIAGETLKSARLWRYADGATINEDVERSVGFNILPVGYDTYPKTATNDNQAELFGTDAGFWTMTDEEYCNSELPIVKLFTTAGSVTQRGAQLDNLFSVRLVRDCVEGCPEEYETILGSSYPVGPITSPCGVEYCKIWTLSNFYSTGNGFEGEKIEGDNVPPLKEYAYFINECDGRKKRMMEGESIVITDDEQNPNRHEYRIINGELVDTFDEVKNLVNVTSGELDTKIITLSGGVESVNDELTLQITNLREDMEDSIIALSGETAGAINSLRADTAIAVREIQDGLSAFTESSVVSINNVLTNLTASASSLSNKLNEEIERSISADTSISERVSSLENKDTEIYSELSGINGAISDVNREINNLSGSVETYIEVLQSDFNSANGRINTLSAETAEINSSLSDLMNSMENADDAVLSSANTYTDERVNEINAVKINDLYFDTLSKYIKLVKADGTLTTGISAEDFLKDSVLTRVEYDEGNERLIFVWNNDDASRTYIPLAKLSNVYKVSSDSLAYLKMSGTDISAIVDKADGFEKTLATTKFVEDEISEAASGINSTLDTLVNENNENRNDIDKLNGDKSVPGSVAHTIDDKFNTSILTAGLPVTTVSVDDARNHSLVRTILVDGETKYFVSNNAKDMEATDNDGASVGLNYYINLLETKIKDLKDENDALKERVEQLEASALHEDDVKNIIKNYLSGTSREIKVEENGEKLKIGFADDAVFGWTM